MEPRDVRRLPARGGDPRPDELGVDLIFPLAFLALLVPLVRTRVELVVAVASGALAFGLARALPGGLPILVTGIAGSLLGAFLTRGTPPDSHDRRRRRGAGGRMTFWLTVAGMVAVTFGSRYAGLALRTELPDFWMRFLHFVPIAVFAALVTPSLEGDRGDGRDPPRGRRGGRRRGLADAASSGSRSPSGWRCSGCCACRSRRSVRQPSA